MPAQQQRGALRSDGGTLDGYCRALGRKGTSLGNDGSSLTERDRLPCYISRWVANPDLCAAEAAARSAGRAAEAL
jgi:hypothetical protein